MYSQNSQGKASKGSVQTKISNGRIQLVFSHPIVNSKRFYLSTGYDNTPIGKQRTWERYTEFKKPQVS